MLGIEPLTIGLQGQCSVPKPWRITYFNSYLLYSLSIYHFTLSSPDTLLLFLDYKPKSGDSLDTFTDNFTAKEVQIIYRLFLCSELLPTVFTPRLPSQPASNVGG